MKIHRVTTVIVFFVLSAAVTFASGLQDKKDFSDKIEIISREEGSGTRGAFSELLQIEKEDTPMKYSVVSASTADVITLVAEKKSTIGYISLGSLDKSVKAVKIDGVDANVANIKDGKYKMARPFTIVTKETELSDQAQDFIRFILSSTGQSIVVKNGYISAVKNPDYIATNKQGKITIDGSSSVFPLMKKLAGSYMELNPSTDIEVFQSDSTAGIKKAAAGDVDIGTASRKLTSEEKNNGIYHSVIAMDGIAIIVNKANPVRSLSSDSIRRIYTGNITEWSEIK